MAKNGEKKTEKKEKADARVSWQRWLVPALAVLIVLFIGVNAWLFFSSQNPGNPSNPAPSDPLPEANGESTELFWLLPSDCSDCSDLNALVEGITQFGVSPTIRQLRANDPLFQQLIDQYSIQSLPAMVLKPSSADFAALQEVWPTVGSVEADNVLVLRKTPLPYFDLASDSVKGKVEMWTIEKPECPDCSEPISKAVLESLGVFVVRENHWTDSDEAAQQFIRDYNISRLPVLVLSAEIRDYLEYEQLVAQLELAGTFESDNHWVLRSVAPYYWDLVLDRKVGALSSIQLLPQECDECLDVNALQEQAAQAFGLKVETMRIVDVNSAEGMQLVSDLNIAFLPTFVLSGELFAYPGIDEALGNSGFEKQGEQFVFTAVDQWGEPYWDVNSQSVVLPAADESLGS